MSTDGNGGGKVEEVPVDTLTLMYDRIHDHLEVGGTCSSLDLMLDMLARATRTIEVQYRQQKALEFQQKIADARGAADLARRVGLGR